VTKLAAPGLLRPGEVARLLGIDESTVRLADEQGRFRADQRTPGGHRRYDPDTTLDFYDECRRMAGKRHASTADAIDDPDVRSYYSTVIEQIGTGRLAHLSVLCTVAGCGWVTPLPRSLGTGAGARHFAERLYVGHLLDRHYDRREVGAITTEARVLSHGTTQEGQAGRS